jgi:hypothetical protein
MKRLILVRAPHLLLLLSMLALPLPVQAEEPAAEFLEVLRQRGYFDVAEHYLENMATSSLAPEGFRDRIDYERAVILIRGASLQGSPQLRAKRLAKAEQLIQKFMTDFPDHMLKDSARGQLGSLLQQRADDNVAVAKKPGQVNREALLAQAQAQYDRAFEVFTESKEAIKGRLAGMNSTRYDPDTQQQEIRIRDELRRDYLQMQLVSALLLEEAAETVDVGSEKHTDYLTRAAAGFKEIHGKYRQLQAGIYAHLYEGRCLQKLGKLEDAVTNYADVLRQPENDAFRDAKTNALALALECWLDEKQKKYSEAVSRGNAYVGTMRGDESSELVWFRLRFLVARANKLYADQLVAKDPKDELADQSYGEATRILRLLVKVPSAYRDKARRLLTSLPGGARFAGVDRPEPTTLSEATERAKDSLDEMNTAELLLRLLPERIAGESDQEVKKDLQGQLEEAGTMVNTKRAESMKYYRLALEMVEADTPADMVHATYYFLCFLHYKADAYYNAAVLGEFLAHRYPESPTAIQGAKIAMACYQKLYAEAEGDRQFETDRMTAIAQYTVETWPDRPEADDARMKLIPVMIARGRIDLATQYTGAMIDNTVQKQTMQRRLGRALWFNYRVGASAYRKLEESGADSSELATRQAELEKLRIQAAAQLKLGLQNLKNAVPDKSLVSASLSLCQYYVETGDPAKAIAMMEAPTIGILSLTRKNDPSTKLATKNVFAQEVYKMALRAYIGDMSSAEDPQQRMDQAKSVMESLNNTVGADDAGKTQLVAIYYGMARDLESQLKLSESEEQRSSLAKGFETFLKEVGEASDEFNVKNWVAETLNGLGKSFDTGDELTPEARKYYEKSMSTLTGIITKAESDTSWLNADEKKAAGYLVQLRLRLARMQRQLRYFGKAVDSFSRILDGNQMMLEIQVDAARTYQQWAAYGQDKDGRPGKDKSGKLIDTRRLYLSAILGTRKGADGKNIVWGWNRIASITSRFQPKYNETLYEARFSLAQCRYSYALSKTGSEKTKYLGYAKREILNTYRVYPSMGGEQMKARSNQLLKKIQGDLKEKQSGLPQAAGGT